MCLNTLFFNVGTLVTIKGLKAYIDQNRVLDLHLLYGQKHPSDRLVIMLSNVIQHICYQSHSTVTIFKLENLHLLSERSHIDVQLLISSVYTETKKITCDTLSCHFNTSNCFEAWVKRKRKVTTCKISWNNFEEALTTHTSFLSTTLWLSRN